MGNPPDFFSKDRNNIRARFIPGRTQSNHEHPSEGPILPIAKPETDNTSETGGLNIQDGRRLSSGSDPGKLPGDGHGVDHASDAGTLATPGHHHGPKPTTGNDIVYPIPSTSPPPAPPPDKSEDARAGVPTIAPAGEPDEKPNITTRLLQGSKRFGKHTKDALLHSWVNVLLVFVPVGIIAAALGLNASIVFALNAVAIVPLAGLLSHATESVASRLGDTLGALLNVSFGNAVELIIFIIALVKNEIRIVQASLLGSILANLLLILGMAFLFGGLRYREQIYNNTVTQMSACLLSLSVMSLLLPTAFHASFNLNSATLADAAVLRISRGTSVVLLLVYVLYLLFQLKSHAYMYESTPQEIIDEEARPGVLAEMLASSSSSDASSSSDSTDSDTSGSIITTGKKIRKKMFRRRRRKSSASVSSVTASSAVHSVLSSPSIVEQQGNYWDSQVNSHQPSRRESTLGVIASGDEGDADTEAGHLGIGPRIRDFVINTEIAAPRDSDSKSPDGKMQRKKHQKKYHRKRHHHHLNHHDAEKEAIRHHELAVPNSDVEKPADLDKDNNAVTDGRPTVGFADDVPGQVQTADQSHGKLAFNMRQLSSRAAFRPALPKMLSNNVFVQPAPSLEPARRPVGPVRFKSADSSLRRTSSLPDRLNSQPSATATTTVIARSDPLPPFQHQRQPIRKITTEDAEKIVDGHEENPYMSRTAAVVLLLVSTGLVAVCAEFMVDAIPQMIANSPSVSQAFIGLIVLPIVGNAAEHVTAVTVATKNKMDLAIGVAVGSSIQIALFVTPFVVLLGWILERDMSLYFNLFETISLFVTAFVVNFLVLDGRSNYLEGSLLIAAYIIIALGAFFYPQSAAQSAVGGAGSD